MTTVLKLLWFPLVLAAVFFIVAAITHFAAVSPFAILAVLIFVAFALIGYGIAETNGWFE